LVPKVTSPFGAKSPPFGVKSPPLWCQISPLVPKSDRNLP
jgi:hypothetical protein